jgi:magnesium-transporting ATPase (P-type)
MKQFILNAQFISLCVGGFCLLCLLGAEPNSTESSMYEYEHFCDKGHFGWYLLWAFGLSVLVFFVTTAIRYYQSINEK